MPDALADAPLTTTNLRQSATAAITFTCTPLGSGPRLGGDRDEDATLDGDDCAAADAGAFLAPAEVSALTVGQAISTTLSWSEQAGSTGNGVLYDVLGGDLANLRSLGVSATVCRAAGLSAATHVDMLTDPVPGAAHFYLVRARNSCGTATLGSGRESVDTLVCSTP